MPNYLYRADDGEELWEIRSIDDREKPIIIEDKVYHYVVTTPKAETIFAGPGWTDRGNIKYEDKDEYKARVEKEKRRKEWAQRLKEEG